MTRSAAALSPATARERVAGLQSRIQGMQAVGLSGSAPSGSALSGSAPSRSGEPNSGQSASGLPAPAPLAALFPQGVLQEGAVYSVDDSTSLLMALLAGPSAAGAWCGVVGLPDFGAEAARAFGIDLDRLVIVPAPGAAWLTVTAALADVLPLVVTRPLTPVGAADAARLAGRLRQRRSTLIAVGDWPNSEARLGIRSGQWNGLGDGHGYLTGREIVVTASGRAAMGRPRTARMLLAGTALTAPGFAGAEFASPGLDPSRLRARTA